jgi:hypothetical protein
VSTQIKCVVGHEPVRYRRYKRWATVRSYTRTFMVIPPEDAETYANIADKYSLENATEECRVWCKERIAYHQSGEHPIRYIHVTFPNGDVFQWSEARGWVKKS